MDLWNIEALLLTLSFQNLLSSPHYRQKPNSFLQPVKKKQDFGTNAQKFVSIKEEIDSLNILFTPTKSLWMKLELSR